MSGTGIGIILFACICSISIHTVFGFGETCLDDTKCTQNSEICNPSDKTCVCDTSNNYFYSGSQCVLNIDECLSSPCLNGGTCSDLVNGYTCACKEGFSTKTCSEAALGVACDETGTTCQDINAECGRNEKICLCKSSYYKKHSTSIYGGTCSSISELRVKKITFPEDFVTTSGFKVIWTPPDLASYVNSYVIEWRPKSPDNSLNGGSETVTSSVTALVISTGVTTGKTYTVSVTSKNTQTQSNVPRMISLSKEQAAKPGKPGPIDKDRSDLHASDAYTGIKLYWARPSGGVSGYKIKLSDGTNSESSDPTSAVFTFNRLLLKNGHRYNVTMQTKSETFEGGTYVLGEKYMEEIKTVVTVPTAPRLVTCKGIFDESIVLEWQIPEKQNGDLVRYTVNVFNSLSVNMFNTSTTGVAYTLTIGNLKPGTLYTFRVFTENEMYVSSTYGTQTCQTKAKLSDPPSNLQATEITSRNFTVRWDEPNNTYSEENYGYVIQTRVGEQCIKEVVYRCIGCRTLFEPTQLENMCDASVRQVIDMAKDQLSGKQSWLFHSLLPDTEYKISATAVNSRERGNVAEVTVTTNEEVPQTPFSVEVSNITSTSFLAAWSISDPRPGKTNFTVYIEADYPAPNKEITVTGFTKRSKLIDNLEEFWNYTVSVEASTSKGSRKSPPTIKMQTLPAAPGQVSDFQITDAPGGNYTQMKVTWKAPDILQRNSIIKEYMFEYFSEEKSRFQQSLQHKTIDTYVYTIIVDVRPEHTYTVQVYAVNEQNQDGEKTIESKTTPVGVPINIEYTMHVKIISAYEMIDRRQGMFSVTIVPEFFEESTYGMIRATGLLACAKNCDFSRIKTLQDFNGLRNWKQASDDGFTLYRVTNPAWLLNLYAQIPPCSGRRKRAVRGLIYTVGQDDCTDVASDEYCNGPLSPNTDFVLVAVSCTNGGCLLSKEYGPFSTIPAPISTVQDYNCTTQTVTVGVVLGLIIVILSVYAGYVTVLNRRYRRRKDYSQEHTAKKENKKEQLYVNELMTARTARVEERPSNPAIIKEPESEYSRLDAATREEKSVYDIIHAL